VSHVFIELARGDIDKERDEWIWGYDKVQNFVPKISSLMDLEDFVVLLQHPLKDFFSVVSLSSRKNLSRASFFNYDYSDVLGGYRSLDRILPQDTIEYWSNSDNEVKSKQIELSKTNLDYLRKIIDLCTSRNIQVMFIRCPVHKSINIHMYEDQFWEVKNTLFPEIEFLDFSDFPLEDQDFADQTHLNKSGSEKISVWFNSMLDMGLLNMDEKAEFVRQEIQRIKGL
jgi:hypothetical protein